jgi:hypothetical protein
MTGMATWVLSISTQQTSGWTRLERLEPSSSGEPHTIGVSFPWIEFTGHVKAFYGLFFSRIWNTAMVFCRFSRAQQTQTKYDHPKSSSLHNLLFSSRRRPLVIHADVPSAHIRLWFSPNSTLSGRTWPFLLFCVWVPLPCGEEP